MQTYEKIFNPEYFYNGINNIQFNINNPPKVFLKQSNSNVYIDVKFEKPGNYDVHAIINFKKEFPIVLQTGVMYPNETQHPTDLVSTVLRKPKVANTYLHIGKVTILEGEDLIQPIFIRLAQGLNEGITLNKVKITGFNKIDYPYVEWWNREKNTGKRPYQHANHIVSDSIFDENQIINPTYMYKELIICKWHMHTYCAVINGPSTYMGVDYTANKVVFSVWDADPQQNNVLIKNEVLKVGEKTKTNPFSHEGCGSYFEYKGVNLVLNNKYGFLIHYDEDEANKTTKYSAYFIDLGPIESLYESPKWNHVGTLLHHNVYFKNNRIGGFLENFMTANGHLFRRQVAIGNGWMSRDGINWVNSIHEEAVMDDLKTQTAHTYSQSDGLIAFGLGARVGMSDDGLTKHGELRAYDLYREQIEVPNHLKNVPSSLIKLTL